MATQLGITITEAVPRIPRSLVHDLRAASSVANLKALLTLISQVEDHDAHAAKGLRKLATRYDYEAILKTLPGASI